MVVSASEGYRIWSPQYDATPNPLLALEMRVLEDRLGSVGGMRFLDAGSGTGRWMEWAAARGARVFGVDTCREMIVEAGRKPGLAGRTAMADVSAMPLPDGAFDLAICSFTLGYSRSAAAVLQELARIARQVIVSDLHPMAARAGWTRSFRAAGEIYELAHYAHSTEDLDAAAAAAGLVLQWRDEVSFGEPEREIFRRAGKERAFHDANQIPAVLLSAWNQSPG
jgi:SAM-dependent methyltransferase